MVACEVEVVWKQANGFSGTNPGIKLEKHERIIPKSGECFLVRQGKQLLNDAFINPAHLRFVFALRQFRDR